ncbi:recombinase family protein [Enterococcus devriesei]|uniref:recombinase family protein n=1 Tax=Enterococcus devriesei TaxID=319970 RepID=UPI0036D432A9
MYVAYLRVSSSDQNLARQEQAIIDWQIKNEVETNDLKVFKEKVSGKTISNRNELGSMLSFIREHDTVVVTSLDRIGRNSRDIKEVLQEIKSKGANIEILDLPTFSGVNEPALRDLLTNLVIEVFSYVAESERNKIVERQREGITLAKQRGLYKGRPLKYHEGAQGADKLVYDKVIESLNRGETVKNISQKVGISRKTVYAIKSRATNQMLENQG